MMIVRRDSILTIFWQVKDEHCQANKWRMKVGTENQTLLRYPIANTSVPIENYTDYYVSAVKGECENDGQKVNVTLTIFVSEDVNLSESIFCTIRILNPDSNDTSKVHFVLSNDPTTTGTITSYATSDSASVTTQISTPDVQPDTTSSIAHTKVMHHALLVCVFLALLFHFIH